MKPCDAQTQDPVAGRAQGPWGASDPAPCPASARSRPAPAPARITAGGRPGRGAAAPRTLSPPGPLGPSRAFPCLGPQPAQLRRQASRRSGAPRTRPGQTRRRFHVQDIFERVFFLRAEFCLLRLPDSAVPGLLGDTQSGAGLSEPISASPPVAAPPAKPLRVTKEPCGDVLLLFSEIRNVFRSFPVIRCCLLCHLYLMTDSSLKEIAVYPQIFDSFYLKNTSKRKTFSFQEAQTLAGVRVT